MSERRLIDILSSNYHHELTKSARDFVGDALSGAELTEPKRNHLVDLVVSRSGVFTTARNIVQQFKNQHDDNGKILLAFVVEHMLNIRAQIPNVTDFLEDYLQELVNDVTSDEYIELVESQNSRTSLTEDDGTLSTPKSSSTSVSDELTKTSTNTPIQEENEEITDQKTPAVDPPWSLPFFDYTDLKTTAQKTSTEITRPYIFLFDFNLNQEELHYILEQFNYVNFDLRSASWSNYYNSVMHTNIQKGLPLIHSGDVNITRKQTESSLADLLAYVEENSNTAHIVIVIGSESGSDTGYILRRLINKGYIIHCINLRDDKSAQTLLKANRLELNVVKKYQVTEFLKSLSVDIQPGAEEQLIDSSGTQSILVVTVTDAEMHAVLNTFSTAAGHTWSRKRIGGKTYYYLGVHGGAPVFMVSSEMGNATPGGSLLTVRQAIDDLLPQAIIMCGIAFGLRPNHQVLGDILIARQLQYYEPQKVDIERGQIPRGDRVMCSERLLDRFRSGSIDWKHTKTHSGLFLTGEKLVNDPVFRDWLLENEREAIGGDMEGAGLYAAARFTKVDWIIVKAICDWGDGDKNDEAQQSAARNAAEFVLHVLQLGGWG